MELKRRTMPMWDNLPSVALCTIFCKSSIEDRFKFPFVCRSWAHASRDPRCWASMIADSHPFAADDAFIRASFPYHSVFCDPFRGRRSPHPADCLLRLQMFLGKAAGGAAVTSLFFFPFLTSAIGPSNDDAILTLIAGCCPNLKHLSFHGSYEASEGVILEVIRKCRKLELIDFSDSPYFNPTVLQELKACCPDIRGIRRNGEIQPRFSSHLTCGFSNLRLLNLSDSTILDTDLLNILCMQLQCLDIMRCNNLVKYMYLIKRAYGRIPQLYYD